MNKIFLILLCLFAVSSTSKAQTNHYKNERRIYLWDVTLSTKGFGGKPDIWSDIKDAIVKDINSIIDEDVEIIILPFQVSILEEWKAFATGQGKKDLVKRIQQYDNNDVTNTNICLPMEVVMQKHIDSSKRNVLILLTDGEHTNTSSYPTSKLIEIINRWCNFAKEKDAYAFYVMLTEFAHNDYLVDAIKKSCRISAINGIDINFVELKAPEKISFNIKDDANKPLSISLTYKKNVKIPEGLTFKLEIEENEYIETNGISELSNQNLNFNIKLKQPYEKLKSVLPEESSTPIRAYLSLSDSSKEQHPLVLLLSDVIQINLVNKIEKTLRIYVQPKH